MADDVIEFALDEEEATKLADAQKSIQVNSRIAAQKALSFAEMLALMVNAYNEGVTAQNEWLRLLRRVSKARARQSDDIADLDIIGRRIVFKKTPKDLAKTQDADDEEE